MSGVAHDQVMYDARVRASDSKSAHTGTALQTLAAKEDLAVKLWAGCVKSEGVVVCVRRARAGGVPTRNARVIEKQRFTSAKEQEFSLTDKR